LATIRRRDVDDADFDDAAAIFFFFFFFSLLAVLRCRVYATPVSPRRRYAIVCRYCCHRLFIMPLYAPSAAASQRVRFE